MANGHVTICGALCVSKDRLLYTITTPGAALFSVARLFHCIVVKCLASIQPKTWRTKLIPTTVNMLLIWDFVSTML